MPQATIAGGRTADTEVTLLGSQPRERATGRAADIEAALLGTQPRERMSERKGEQIRERMSGRRDEEATARISVPARLDRRTLRSREQLRDALAAEIQATGDLTRVTVTGLTERAGLTRRTFYSHFHDIPDLVDAVEREALVDIRSLVERIAASHLDELTSSLESLEPAPGSVELLCYFRDNSGHLTALLGKGGDPAFVEKIKTVCADAVCDRALDGIDARALGPFFDYYLSFAISAECGVLTRWLAGGMREDVGTMARLMTALMFVRPGDLYGKKVDFNVPAYALAIMRSSLEAQGPNLGT